MANTNLLTGYLPRSEAATELAVSSRTLDRWHRLRIGPPRTQIGGRIYYGVDDVRDWLKAQREDTPLRQKV